jgi:hypothetical protein
VKLIIFASEIVQMRANNRFFPFGSAQGQDDKSKKDDGAKKMAALKCAAVP